MNNLKSLIWTVVGIIVFVAILRFAWFILPYVLVASLIAYIVFKLKKTFGKKKKSNSTTYSNSYSQNTKTYETNGIDDNFDNGKVIDVDYKEVNK